MSRSAPAPRAIPSGRAGHLGKARDDARASPDPVGADLSPVGPYRGAQRADDQSHRAGAGVHDALGAVADVAGAAAAGGELGGVLQ